MKPNHYARKKRQLKVLVEKLTYFMDTQNEDSIDQFEKLVAKIKNLVQELAFVISKPFLIKTLGAAAILIGISCANPAFAQSFGPPLTNPFGLVSTVSGSHPALADLDGDGDVDLLVGGYQGHIEYFENIGSVIDPQFGAPQMNPFGLDSSYLYSYGVFSYAFPSFVDLDDDGDMDLLIGGWVYENPSGNMLYFENIGDSLNPQFDAPQYNPFGLVGVFSLSNAAAPAFADLDGDGDGDLLVGHGGGYVGDMYYFENTGSSAIPLFSAPQQNPFGLVPTFSGPSPSFADLDVDGDIDLLVVELDYGVFSYYENIGDSLNPQFAVPQGYPFGLVGVGWTADPEFADLDGDGDVDLFVGSGNNIVYFENTTGDGECPPGMTFTSQVQLDSLHANYPNCTEIKGSVFINGSDISNLNGLNVITAIWGNFRIGNNAGGYNPGLINLTGLQNLDSIGENLEIFGNSVLTSLSDLENITSILGNLSVSGNPALPSLNGLENVTLIVGNLQIDDNDALTSLSDLENITSVLGNLSVSDNPVLPSLTGLENVTSIGGILIIGDYNGGNNSLNNLTGLEGLTSITGGLSISQNNALTSLSGLESLTSIGGFLMIYNNDALTSLSGLDNLSSIAGNLTIGGNYAYNGNPSLTDISSLGNIDAGSINNLKIRYNTSLSSCDVQSICDYLASPNGTITISNNAPGCNSVVQVEELCFFTCLSEGIDFYTQAEIDSFHYYYPDCVRIDGDVTISGDDIMNLDGLNGLKYVAGNLEITGNNVLTSLSGLETILKVGGDLWIEDNDNLFNILGLNNVTHIDGVLHIEGNAALTSLFGLENIEQGSIEELFIFNNDSLSECDVFSICEYLSSPGSTVQVYGNAPGCNDQEELEQACESHCLYDGITFTTQQQVDNFQINYPGCNKIEGDVVIKGGNNISNLNGLTGLTFIGGDLSIGKWVAGHANFILDDISGLSNLKFVSGNLTIAQNHVLSDLTGLDSLISIGGMLYIRANGSLSNLTGLQNINSGSISNLTIKQNTSLSECAIESICDYLASPNGTVTIENNAPGCNSQQQVQDSCDSITFVKEIAFESTFIISPNPLESITLIEYTLKNNSPVTLKILDLSGREMKMLVNEVQTQGEQKVVFNTADLPAGIYFCVLKTSEGVQTKKMIKL